MGFFICAICVICGSLLLSDEFCVIITPMKPNKPHAAATERNREPILQVLREHFADRRRVLEIGSGTGQHAVYFAKALPHTMWQASDRQENLAGIDLWLDEARLLNTPPAMLLDVAGDWPVEQFDAVFGANILHIMSWPEVEHMFAGLRMTLSPTAKLAIYGPFNYRGLFTSDSNAAFDRALKVEAPHRGIRDFERVDALAKTIGLKLVADIAMPANNRCLVWQRHSG
jgi:trans-aconitate methyltransferase